MDFDSIVSLIGSLGFPIVCCVVLFKQNGELRNMIDKSNSELRNSIDSLKEVLVELKGRLSKDERED